MAYERASRDSPTCMLVLVVCALAAHSLVLVGNLSTSNLLKSLGSSSRGWSRVGLSLSNALSHELDPAMQKVSLSLASALDMGAKVERSIDLTFSIAGSTTDSALASYNASQQDIQEFKVTIMGEVERMTSTLMTKVGEFVGRFLELLRPALMKVQEWLTSFSDKAHSMLQQLSGTLDKVQTIFDQVLAEISVSKGGNLEDMVYYTYRLFDTDMSGLIVESDLQNVAQLYGIDALAGAKATELFAKYDKDSKGGLDGQEFTLFVHDPSIPDMMTSMLRGYAIRLGDVSGRLRSAKMTDEVAKAVVNYVNLECANNVTVATWMAERLSNGSVPVEFTAAVLKNLALDFDNPNKLTVVDVGLLLVKEIMRSRTDVVVEALGNLTSPSYWVDEGFFLSDQLPTVRRVADWVAQAPNGPSTLAGSLLSGEASPGAAQNEPLTAQETVAAVLDLAQAQLTRYTVDERVVELEETADTYRSVASQSLRDQLLGGSRAAAPREKLAFGKGQRAASSTLKFAEFLANNASLAAAAYLQECFDYSGASSGALESFATQVSLMFKKTQHFVNLMETYASPAGVDRLMQQATNFTQRAGEDVRLALESYVNSRLEQMLCLQNATDPTTCIAPLMEIPGFDGALHLITAILGEMRNVLPIVIEDLQLARKQVAVVASTTKLVMQVLGQNAPPYFDHIAELLQNMWVAYFVTYTLLTLGFGLYGWWIAGRGHHSSQARHGDVVYQAPTGFRERLRACGIACSGMMKGCNDNSLIFWSVLMVVEIVVLLIFVLALFVCVCAGVQAFLAAGCQSVYILGDPTVCTGAMYSAKAFLQSFWSVLATSLGLDSVEDLCEEQRLLTCDIIKREAGLSLVVTVVSGILAAAFSLQLVVESAIMHEQQRWQRIMDAEAKNL